MSIIYIDKQLYETFLFSEKLRPGFEPATYDTNRLAQRASTSTHWARSPFLKKNGSLPVAIGIEVSHQCTRHLL